MAKRTAIQTPNTHKKYEALRPTLVALTQEVEFILREAVGEAEIKIHDIECRVKTFESLSRKLQDRSSVRTPVVDDLVGVRVICLFMSDLDKIQSVVSSEFDVLRVDDKISSATDSFGYMSIHCICKLQENVSGRRYDAIKDLRFEVQIRTLCMHAWAAISHYLDYKSEWDIPDHLKKGLNALSGLFYVADNQYEELFRARERSRIDAREIVVSKDSSGTPINLDTMSAALSSMFPTREHDGPSHISSLIQELIEAGFHTIEQIEKAVKNGEDDLKKSEQSIIKLMKTKSNYYTDVGAVRISLCKSHDGYKEVYDRKTQEALSKSKTRRQSTSSRKSTKT